MTRTQTPLHLPRRVPDLPAEQMSMAYFKMAFLATAQQRRQYSQILEELPRDDRLTAEYTIHLIREGKLSDIIASDLDDVYSKLAGKLQG